MKELARQLADTSDEFDDVTALLERWNGSPENVAEDIFRVQNPDTGKIEPVQLFDPYQPQFLHAFFYGDATTINVFKGRRIGISFIACVAILIDAMTHPDGFYAIVSRSKSQAKDRIDDIYDLIENARVDFQLKTDNRDEIEFWNGATIRAFSGSPDTSRGADAARVVFVDEMAFLDNQEQTMRAFRPFVALGDSVMMQVSTPKTTNDVFLNTHHRGSPSGENGVISIKQPSFKNADEINPEVSLFEQDVEPVRSDMNLQAIEDERAEDPRGFAQEYLCEPISERYRFFDEESVHTAAQRGTGDYAWGKYTNPQYNGVMVMGVDLAKKHDDTAIAVVEHHNDKRLLRYHETVDDLTLREAGIQGADSSNSDHIARRIKQLYDQLYVDYIIYDETGAGPFFDSDLRQYIGRGVNAFNFTDKDAVAEMMRNLNYGLHNNLVTLTEDKQLTDQICAIVKDQSEYQKPKFSGKEHSPDGKDDLAMALALASYPPTLDTTGKPQVKQRENVTRPDKQTEPVVDDNRFTGLKVTSNSGSRNSRERTHKRRHRRPSRRSR